mgnify:CR=1 FL=1
MIHFICNFHRVFCFAGHFRVKRVGKDLNRSIGNASTYCSFFNIDVSEQFTWHLLALILKYFLPPLSGTTYSLRTHSLLQIWHRMLNDIQLQQHTFLSRNIEWTMNNRTNWFFDNEEQVYIHHHNQYAPSRSGQRMDFVFA